MAERLRGDGFKNAVGMTGGMQGWLEAGYPVVTYKNGTEEPMSLDDFNEWDRAPGIRIEYKSLCGELEKAYEIAHAMQLKYPQLRLTRSYKFSDQWPQRTPEQLAEIKDQNVIFSIVYGDPSQTKFYIGELPTQDQLDKDIAKILSNMKTH